MEFYRFNEPVSEWSATLPYVVSPPPRVIPRKATAKAAADASALGTAFRAHPHDLGRALEDWETLQLEHGRRLVNQTIALGTRSVKREMGQGLLWTDLQHTIQSLEGIALPQRAGSDHQDD